MKSDLKKLRHKSASMCVSSDWCQGYNEAVDDARQHIEELEAANMSVAVCSQHVEDIRQGDCVICELESLQRQLDEALRVMVEQPHFPEMEAQRIREMKDD